MYIDVSFPRPSLSPRLGILVHWLPIDSVLLTEPSQYLEFAISANVEFQRDFIGGGKFDNI